MRRHLRGLRRRAMLPGQGNGHEHAYVSLQAVRLMGTPPIDIIALAKAAHARGLNTPSGVAAHLEGLIARNTVYLERRRHNGQSTHFDTLVADDNEALAVAVIYLEGIGDLSDLYRSTERVVRYTALQIASGYGTDTNAIITDILGES